MEDKQELPRYSGPVDHLRYGFRSLETELSAPHPVETIQNNFSELNWVRKIETVRRIHGSGFAMTLATDRANLMKKHKLPGLESSSILLDTVTGNDLTVEFEDFLNGKLYLQGLLCLMMYSYSFCRLVTILIIIVYIFTVL